MKFAVAGASGFVGSALVRRLEAQGRRIIHLEIGEPPAGGATG